MTANRYKVDDKIEIFFISDDTCLFPNVISRLLTVSNFLKCHWW